MFRFCIRLTIFVSVVFCSKLALADQCASLFVERRNPVSINGKQYFDSQIQTALNDFIKPLRFIEIVDHNNAKIYAGINAKEHFNELLQRHLKVYESPRKLRQSRLMDPELKRALLHARNQEEAAKVYTNYFLSQHKTVDLKNESIMDYLLDSPNIAKVKVNLTPEGKIANIQINQLPPGTYHMRLLGKGQIKEATFQIP